MRRNTEVFPPPREPSLCTFAWKQASESRLAHARNGRGPLVGSGDRPAPAFAGNAVVKACAGRVPGCRPEGELDQRPGWLALPQAKRAPRPAVGDLQVRGAMRVETRIGVPAGIRGPRFHDCLCPGAVAPPTCFRRWRGCSCRHVAVEIVGIAGTLSETERSL